MISEYIIVKGADGFGTLEKKIEKLIQDGWQPIGGVSAILEVDESVKEPFTALYQAMVK